MAAQPDLLGLVARQVIAVLAGIESMDEVKDLRVRVAPGRATQANVTPVEKCGRRVRTHSRNSTVNCMRPRRRRDQSLICAYGSKCFSLISEPP
jgi:hypothetical protein